MANPLDIEPHPSAERVASGSGSSIDIGEGRSAVKLELEVTAASGASPQLNVTVETSPSGSGSWAPVDSFALVGGVGFQELVCAGCRRFVRVSWTITGVTISFTFGVKGEAHQLFASPENLTNHAIAKASIESIPLKERAAALLQATSDAASAFQSSHTMPIVTWGQDVRGRVSSIAVFYALQSRGFSPNRESDVLIVKGYDDAQLWLKEVAAGRRQPDGMVDSTPEVFEGGSHAVSKPLRGW